MSSSNEELIKSIWERVGITNDNLKHFAASRKNFIQEATTQAGMSTDEAIKRFNEIVQSMIDDMDASVKAITDIESND